MTVLDEQGRLFGHINVVDALVGLVALSVVMAGLALVTSSGGASSAASFGVVVEMDSVMPAVADAVQPGLSLQHGGQTVAEVTAVSASPATVLVQNGTEYSTASHPIRKDLRVTLIVRGEVRDGVYHYDDEAVRIGDGLRIDFPTVTVAGNVTAFTDPTEVPA